MARAWISTLKRFPSLEILWLLVIVLLQHITVFNNSGRAVVYGTAVVLLVAWWKKLRPVLLFGTLFLLTYFLVPKTLPLSFYRVPGISYLVPAMLSLLVAYALKLFFYKDWFGSSRLDRLSLWFTLVTVVASSVSLLGWAVAFNHFNDFRESLLWLADFSPWVVFFLIIPAMAMVNAAAEEIFFRGMLQDTLALCTSNRALVLATQAASFAAIHYRGGFPSGKLGYLMTFVYGLALGYLKVRSGGLKLPWFAHVLADVTIFVIVTTVKG